MANERGPGQKPIANNSTQYQKLRVTLHQAINFTALIAQDGSHELECPLAIRALF